MAKRPKSNQALTNYDAGNLIRDPGERWVILSNVIVRAAQRLTLAEKRLISFAAATLDSRRPQRSTAERPLVTKVTAEDYAEQFGVDRNTAYEQLQSGAVNLFNRQITFYEAHPNPKRQPIRNVMRWIGGAKYHDGEGWIELHWWHLVMPYLTGIHRDFTEYQLKQASALRSIYSWRLLELLSQYKDTGWCELTIDEFAHAMEATEKQRLDFNNLRRRMIEPAVKELSQKDGWLIQWHPQKKGRKVASLRFEFMRNPQGRLALDEPRQPAPPPAPLTLDEPPPAPRRRPPKGSAEPIATVEAVQSENPPRRRMPTALELSQFAKDGEPEESALRRWYQQR